MRRPRQDALWTKQLDEGVHDAGIAVLSFALAFRHQYPTRRGAEEAGEHPRPDQASAAAVIEKGLDWQCSDRDRAPR
jgi:hypothetical protein